MADLIELETTKREETGTNEVYHLREEGFLPGILYGNGKENIPLKIDRYDMEHALSNPGRIYELSLNGDTEPAKIKDVQWDHLGEDILHVDFERVNLDEPVEIWVPLVTVGTSSIIEGRGAYLQQHLQSMLVSCPPDRIPDQIPISIEGISIGDTIHLNDLELPEDVEPAYEENRLIISVHEAREVLEEEEEEMELAPTALEPEVVGEEEEELEGEEAEEAAGEAEATEEAAEGEEE